jgi:hypothetical protein
MALSKALAYSPSARWRKALAATLSSAIALLLCGVRAPVQSAPAPEYQLKALFLFNFAQFVGWPANAFPDPNAPLVIGVLGQDPFGGYLDDAVRGERANSRQVVVQRYSRVEDIKNCQVLFISRSVSDQLDHIVASLKYRKILTVSDSDNASGRGVVIRLVTEQNKIKLRINVEAAKAANLTISSKLLRLAERD